MLQATSILLALLIGFLLVQAFDPVRNMQPRWAAILFVPALGTGIGVGLTSVVFLLLDVAGLATPPAIFGTDIALVVGLAWQYFRSRSSRSARSSSDATTPGFRWTWLLAIAFGMVLVIAWVSRGSDGDCPPGWRLGRLGRFGTCAPSFWLTPAAHGAMRYRLC